MRKINNIVIHCSNTRDVADIDLDYIRRIHITNYGFPDIAFHYIVKRDGTIQNSLLESKYYITNEPNSISICYIGGRDGYYRAIDTRTIELKKALLSLIKSLLYKYNLKSSDVFVCDKCCSNLNI